MNFRLVFFIVFSFLLAGARAEGNPYSEKTIKRALKYANKVWSEHEVGLEPLVADPSSGNYSSQDTLFKLIGMESTHLGYLLLSSAKGRFDFFDFMVIYTRELELVELRILVYRSEQGSQVTSRVWLKQFYGSPPFENKQYGSDVNALSGATFSAKSLTEQVNRLNSLMMELHR
ncbi:MAG: FMN-binding protein [Bacteroidales bacterium]|nr:FMN-binding protein [Bacteroidales bacterium]